MSASSRSMHPSAVNCSAGYTHSRPPVPPPPFFFNNAVVSRATLQKAHRHVNPENSAELLDSTINARLETSCMHWAQHSWTQLSLHHLDAPVISQLSFNTIICHWGEKIKKSLTIERRLFLWKRQPAVAVNDAMMCVTCNSQVATKTEKTNPMCSE